MPPENAVVPTAPTLVDFIYAPVVNYALQQAHVPIVRRLALKNDTSRDWHDVRIYIALTPDFATSFEHRVDVLPAGGALELDAVKMPVRAAFLAELTERMEGHLHLKITAGEELLLEEHRDIAILPYDYWHGVSLLPEGIAAFITPNHPQMASIIRRASAILAGWTGSPAFDEYQSRNPDRVRKQMAAIYEALAELEIIYCSVPASFEEHGQRVRLADAVLAQKMGNCLDLSLLYAACLEAVGIRPIIVIVHGHAFAGAWLIEESFADPVNDDPSLLTKRAAAGINEIALVESTSRCAGSSTQFDDAVRAAESRMLNAAEFLLFVDVHRARFSRIRPLPLRIATGNGFEMMEETPQATRRSGAPEALSQTVTVTEDGTPMAIGKLQLWERKLLDLTLRNNLLNLRVTKGTIQFIHIDPARLEDALADGKEFQILPKPADWDNPLRAAGLYQALHDADLMLELAAQELGQNRLRCYLTETELTANITALYRASRTAIEENGASTLYIALGFLKWFETAASEAPRYAPILLLPVEIVRKTARVGYVVRSREEEPMLNITLLEKLRQDYGVSIGGLDVLPRDEKGVDVRQIFGVVRRVIMAQARWDVEEQAVLGAFSFNKFILWNDIHNNAHHLLRNPVVASLVSGRLEWEVSPEAPRALDEAFAPQSIALPIATDSSQLEAIISSGEGKSFVLHGPPGTGKSQTITNIIANALFAGRKVLFVAAKKAALEVVESRLESIGIGPFCLELHSNKAKKISIMEQLKRATAIPHKPAPESFTREAERLAILRAELNDYVKALHQVWPFGWSLYEAFSRWSAEESGVSDRIAISGEALAMLGAGGLQDWSEAVTELALVARAVGQPSEHPLKGIAAPTYSPQLKTDASNAIRDYADKLQTLEGLMPAVAGILRINSAGHAPAATHSLANLADALLKAPDMPPTLLALESPAPSAARIKSWTQQGRQRDALREGLLQQFSKGILTISTAQLQSDWNIASNKWFLPRWLGQGKVRKALQAFSAGPLARREVPGVLQDASAYQEAAQQVAGSRNEISAAGFLWREDGAADWDAIDQSTDTSIALNAALMPLMRDDAIRAWRRDLAAVAADGTKSFLDHHRMSLEAFIQAEAEATAARMRLHALLQVREEPFAALEASWMVPEKARLTRWLMGLDKLKDWCAWNAASQKATALGLADVSATLERNECAPGSLEAAFRKSLARTAAEYIIGQSPELAQFNATLFEEKINRFKALSDRFEALTREELYARLAARIPDFSVEASQSSEVGILQRAIRSNGRGLSIRKLFDGIPNLLARLTPCMLMSPISVAQYFDAAAPKFDLVIFDEASQLPTCEAAGAIARGTSLIVVGDPKQMPPTSFFATAQVDEDNLEQEDLESILDDCLALSMPSRHLLWHYRSKHESLIAFSNAKYYDNALLTFPSTDDLATKVRYVHVPGYYDKGKTRQNKAEATAIVAEIVRRLQDPALRRRSMGVVTFSVVQQDLIEDMLTEEFRKAPELEKAALESTERLFIKNLENVQGDERDVILFSVCYGPDEQGKVGLNFGPLNRDGGWRRLNVAVSRARYEMMVFATLRADQIDLARTGAEGVAGLRDFLAFAENGKAALPAKGAAGAAPVDALTDRIADAIRARGHEVHGSVGCSGYRIDLAVVHPHKPHEYLLGILCDGPAYGAARTARDREVAQQGVLRALGWRLHRVWSADWWEKPEAVLAGVEAAIADALAQKDDEPLPPAPEAPPVLLPEAEEAGVPMALNSLAAPTTPSSTQSSKAMPYEACQLSPVRNATADQFLEPRSRRRIEGQIDQVLEEEGPISKALLCERVLDAWSMRAGSRVMAHLESIVEGMNPQQTEHGAQLVILWPASQQPEAYDRYRVAAGEADKRDAADLPPEEIAVAAREVLARQLSLPRADLVRECARVMGYARMGSKVEEAMGAGLDWAVAQGMMRLDGGRVVV